MWSRFAFLAALAVAGLFYAALIWQFDKPISEVWPLFPLVLVFLFLAAIAWDWIDHNRRPPT